MKPPKKYPAGSKFRGAVQLLENVVFWKIPGVMKKVKVALFNSSGKRLKYFLEVNDIKSKILDECCVVL